MDSPEQVPDSVFHPAPGQSGEDSAAPPSPDRAPRTWKVTLAYDGGPFSGWQVQPGRSTVQGALADAIEQITGETVLPQGSGRTDAGVHALAQVASFALRAPIPARNLHRALNHALPPAIRVTQAELAPDHFHARHSARSKLYEYRIWRAELCPPWTAPYVYACNWPLDLAAIAAAATCICGEHDFTSFAASEPDRTARTPSVQLCTSALEHVCRVPGVSSNAGGTGSAGVLSQAGDGDAGVSSQAAGSGCVRRVLSSEWQQTTPDLLCYRVRGTGFLHHMVRNLVGTFLAVGRGQLTPGDLPRILAARDRSAAGATAPAQGLFLHSVEY